MRHLHSQHPRGCGVEKQLVMVVQVDRQLVPQLCRVTSFPGRCCRRHPAAWKQPGVAMQGGG
jgi:hypothetical protein